MLRIDPALSAEILRVSNSALYGLSRRVDNVSHAIVVLGTEVVKRLALTVALGRFSHGFLRNQGLRICWDHSVACALIAEELAQAMDVAKDRAYTAGLLHDVGRLALLACYPNEYGNLIVGLFRVLSGRRSQIEFPTVEIDGVDEVLLIAETARRGLDPLNP